jgi:hypothetical protein
MQPADLPLDIYRGDTTRFQVKLWSNGGTTPFDLTGATAKAQIRERPAGVQITDLQCVITLPNIIDVALLSDDSHKLPSKGAWDLQLTFLSGDVLTPLAGAVTVTPDVTDSTPPILPPTP